MSIAEILDHGAPHPWANIRVNDLTIDGILFAGDLGTFTITYSGPLAAPTAFSVDYYKVGRIATLIFRDVITVPNGGVAGPFVSAPGSIPVELFPDFIGGFSPFSYPCKVVDGGIISTNAGLLTIANTGTISIFFNLANANFGTTGQRGMFGTTVSYRTAI